MKKYLVVGGTVISRADGQAHFINARKLCELYKVNPDECIMVDNRDDMVAAGVEAKSLILLEPKYDGNYTL